MAAFDSRADTLVQLRQAYNQDVRRISGGAVTGYVAMTPRAAVERYRLGPVDLANLRGLTEIFPADARIAVRGELIVADGEEMVASAAPPRFRLYGAMTAGGERAFVPLDVSGLDAPALDLIARHCTALPCPATVAGRVGEVEAERVTNPFSATGVLTVMVGLVADHVGFHETTR
ncbi:MAG: hypothetical protein OXR84_11240 [Magnetovibrio sp.]|nr:hypothetical protein [Magnetovibrio sp.]